MTRNRASAKAAGTWLETVTAAYLAENYDERIERRAKNGSKDRGDIAAARVNGHRLVIECKNEKGMSLPAWTREAKTEAVNDGAPVGVVVHKRHGSAKASEQWVSMTLEDLVALLKLVEKTT